MRQKVIFWIPRVLSVILLFWWGLFIYLSHGFTIPSIFEWVFWAVLSIITFVSWKFEFLGGSLYFFGGLFYLIVGFGRVSLVGYLMVPIPLLLMGSIFMLVGHKKRKIHEK
ncbi:MAG: hypothetical protein HQ564_08400 [Candidatus Saganbacteria bacterium]|nr:hypothetical protein [Candidatus Saganbacteria bacterium]